uniref:Uncharacterized protein n=1 Tax=Anopheles melas TaxID=34690 RepID=A0A182UAN2_9DIPT
MTFVAAKPDFGVDVMIRGSVAVQGTAVMIEERLSELTKHMSFSLVSSYGLLSDLRTQMDLLARKVDELPPILAAIEKLVKLSIKQELQDSFQTLYSSVQLMAGAVLQLTAAVVDNPVSIDVSIVNMSDDQDEVALTVREQFSKLTPYKIILTSVASVTFSRAYELGLYLADVAAMKGPYGLYCLNKYASMVEQLLPRVRDGLIVCYRQEHKRLRTLRTSLLNMYATFVYDFEDLFDQLQLCTAESGNFSFVTAVNGLYTQLVVQMKKKLELMKSFLVAETTSSARRLLLCGTEASLAVANDRAQLWSEIGECRKKGPSYNVPMMEA